MSSATVTAPRSPDAAATSPGYQGSDGASTQQTTELPASTEMEGQAAPASEPAKATEVVEPNTKAAAVEAASEKDVGGAKAGEEDATPPREVSDNSTTMMFSRKIKSFFFPFSDEMYAFLVCRSFIPQQPHAVSYWTMFHPRRREGEIGVHL